MCKRQQSWKTTECSVLPHVVRTQNYSALFLEACAQAPSPTVVVSAGFGSGSIGVLDVGEVL